MSSTRPQQENTNTLISTMTNGPASIGVIMDGNRRYAKELGLPTLEGHRRGLSKISELLEWTQEAGIKEVVLYAFSTENWNRAEEEVGYLMDLFEYAFTTQFNSFIDKGGRIRFIGQRDRFPEKLQARMKEAEAKSSEGTAGTLIVALSYGGRAEILSAVNKLLLEGREQVTEAELRGAMWSANLLDPDLIIRTGGDKRLSNFLTWQSVYSELFFTETKWPAFGKEEFDAILSDYASRERRLGK